MQSIINDLIKVSDNNNYDTFYTSEVIEELLRDLKETFSLVEVDDEELEETLLPYRNDVMGYSLSNDDFIDILPKLLNT